MTECMKAFNEVRRNFLGLVECAESHIVDRKKLENSLSSVVNAIASIKDCPDLDSPHTYNEVMGQVSEVGHKAAAIQLDITDLVNQQQTLTERAPALTV